MPVAAAIETRVLDAILTACAAIGTPPTSWRTVPYAILDGAPNDEMGVLDRPRLFVQHVHSDPDPAGANTVPARHNWTLTFIVWVGAATQRSMQAARADVLQAIYAAEGAFTDAFRAPLFPGTFEAHNNMATAGIWLGTQVFTIDVETGHDDP